MLRPLAAIVLFVNLSLGSAAAQIAPPGGSSTDMDATVDLSQPMTKEAVAELLSRLSDAEIRSLLLAQLPRDDVTASGETDTDTSEFFYHLTAGAYRDFLTTIEFLPRMIAGQAEIFASFHERIGGPGLWRFIGLLLLVLALAYGAELVFRRIAARWTDLPETPPDTHDLGATLGLLLRRLVSEMGAVIVFVLAARQIGNWMLPADMIPVASLIVLYLIAIPRLAVAIARFFMAPKRPAYRIVRATDGFAKAFTFHVFWFALLVGSSIAILDFNELNGVMRGTLRLGFVFNFAIHLYIALVLWRYRGAMADMMRGYDPNITPAEDWVARMFPYFGIAVSVGIWWVVNVIGSYDNFAFLASVPHYKTMALALLAPALDTAIRGTVRHLGPKMTGEGAVAERAHVAAQRSFIRIGRVLVFGLVLVLIARVWGMTPTVIASTGVGQRVAASAIEFLIILSIGYLIYELIGLFINRKLANELTASGLDPKNEEAVAGEGGGAGGSRLSTVLPLVLLVARTVIVVLFVLLALGNIGIDTTPLLAGAGIVGLAIGFGAQKLVADIVSGIFFLIDDAFRIGEYIDVGHVKGTVERISVRSMQLRHHRGVLNTVPFGDVGHVANFSRDWVVMKFPLRLPYGTDTERVRKMIKKLGQELLDDPEYGGQFLQPLKSQGVVQMEDSAMIVPVKFMARPGEQWMLRRLVLTRIHELFEEKGIRFANREVTVRFGDDRNPEELDAADREAIAGAAGRLIHDEATEHKGTAKPE
jgi:small-conductance mechanosensitive channel